MPVNNDLRGVSVGDTLVIADPHNPRGARRRDVTDVGREWISVRGERCRLSRTTGENDSAYVDPFAWTPAKWDALQKRRDAERELRPAGIDISPGCYLSDTQILTVADLVRSFAGVHGTSEDT